MSKNKSTEKRTIRRSNMTNEDFVVLWQSSTDKAAIDKDYDLGFTAASQRAFNLRKKGVELKKFGRGMAPIDVEALNKFAKEALAKLAKKAAK